VSAISWSGRKSLAIACLLIAIWSGLPWFWKLNGTPMPLAGWFPDPLHWLDAARDNEWSNSSSGFLRRFSVCWLATAGFLTATIVWLPRSLEAPSNVAPKPVRRFRFASGGGSRHDRERWYEINPVAWIARRRTPRWGPMLVFFALFGSTGVIALLHGRSLLRAPDQFLMFVFCLHGLFKLWLAWETSRCLSRDQSIFNQRQQFFIKLYRGFDIIEEEMSSRKNIVSIESHSVLSISFHS
jgi:hypothetical protein